MWSWFDQAREDGEANRRTKESFEERRRWDPDSDARARPDNIDYEWAYSDDDRKRRMWDKSLKDAGFKGRGETELRNDPDLPDDLPHRHTPRSKRGWWLEDREAEGRHKRASHQRRKHVVCVDNTDESLRAFRYAAKHLPRGDRLILTHGLYEGLSGHDEVDEQRMARVRDKYLTACADFDRKCEFRPFSYYSTGDFGDQVCNLAERTGALSVVVGKRAEVSDMRRTLLGSASRSVTSSCRLPVKVVSHKKEHKH